MSKFSENEDDPDIYESSGEEWKDEEVKKNNRRSSQRLSRKPRKTVVEYGSSEEEESDSEPKKKKSKNGFSKKKTKEEDDDDDEQEDDAEEAENEDDEDFSDKDDSKKKLEKSQNSETKVVSTTATSNASSRGIHRKFIPKTIYSEDYALIAICTEGEESATFSLEHEVYYNGKLNLGEFWTRRKFNHPSLAKQALKYITGSFVILKKDAQVGDPAKHPCIWRIDGKALLQKYEAFDEEGKVRHKNTSIYTGWSPMDKDLYSPVTVDVVQHSNQNLTVQLHWDKLKSINFDSD